MIQRLGRFEREIDYYWILAAAHNNGFAGLVGKGVDFLMRDKGRDVDEVARSGFVGEFE